MISPKVKLKALVNIGQSGAVGPQGPQGLPGVDGATLGRAQLSSPQTVYVGTSPTAVTISNASPGVVTWTAHGRASNDPVAFSTSSALPTGLTTGTVYYVKTVLGVDAFTVSATAGGTAINTSTPGSGTHKSWTGNDATGAGTSTAPFMTLQRAWDYAIASYDLRGLYLSIQVRAAHIRDTYCLIAAGEMVGQNGAPRVQVLGDTATPSNCILEGTLACVRVTDYAKLWLQGFKLQGAIGIDCSQFGGVDYSYIDFGSCSSFHYTAAKFGFLFDAGNITISGSAAYHANLQDFAYAAETTGVTTITGTPAFTAYVLCNNGATFTQHTNKTYSGSATGVRFVGSNNSGLGADTLTSLPGSIAGILDETSLYYSLDGADTTPLYPAWTPHTPAITAPGGAVTLGATSVSYKTDKRNRVRTVTGSIVISANTATNWWNLQLPTGNSAANVAFSVSWTLGGIGALQGVLSSGVNAANITKMDGTVPTGTGTIYFTVSYPI